MGLVKLAISNVRNIKSAAFQPSPGINFVVGANASGKTSLIEAIFLLGRAKSFRSTHLREVINRNASGLSVSGRIADESGLQLNIGVRISDRQREMVVGGKKVQSSAGLAYAFPILLIYSTTRSLLYAAPIARRQFLDWGVFHVERSYLECWRKYRRALSQRNALLRAKAAERIEIWDQEVAFYGTMVAQHRERYLALLAPYFTGIVQALLGCRRWELRLSSGWDPKRDFLQVLKEHLAGDIAQAHTQYGPHKGDFAVLVDGMQAKAFLSGGQMKLLALSLMLAQALLLDETVGNGGCLLLDDIASELDAVNQDKLLDFLEQLKVQSFVTATDQGICQGRPFRELTVFHVEQGEIVQV
jgi:DNA replication and repair protein RecF